MTSETVFDHVLGSQAEGYAHTKAYPNTDLEPYETMTRTESPPDQINAPDHYTEGGIETIDVLEAKLSPEELRGYCIGNALKYLTRHNYKGCPEQDLRKAHWYLSRVVEGPAVDLVNVETGEVVPLTNPRAVTCVFPGCRQLRVGGTYCMSHDYLNDPQSSSPANQPETPQEDR